MGQVIVTFVVGFSIFVVCFLVCVVSLAAQHERYLESQQLRKQLEEDKKKQLKEKLLQEMRNKC